MNKYSKGFTLLEITIVLLIVGLMLGGILGPLSTSISSKKIQQEREKLEDIKEALIGYAIVNGHLPCPDTNNDGAAEASCNSAASFVVGNIPNLDLGVIPFDSWGRYYVYAVTQEFTSVQPPNIGCVVGDTFFGLCDNGEITVRRNTLTRTIEVMIADAPAVVVSLGPNGYGGTDQEGNVIASPTANATDELENITLPGDEIFHIREFVTKNQSNSCDDNNASQDFCDFDDQIVWISPNILKYRMVQAGRLP